MVVIIIEKNFLLLFAPVRVEIRLESCLESFEKYWIVCWIVFRVISREKDIFSGGIILISLSGIYRVAIPRNVVTVLSIIYIYIYI